MKLDLNDIDPNRSLTHKVELASKQLPFQDGVADVSSLRLEISVRPDPNGYLLGYQLQANARVTCIRCGRDLEWEIDGQDWIGLRLQQPTAHHAVLDDSDLNIKFLSEPQLDLQELINELIELELPSFPRHQGDPQCDASVPRYRETTDPSDSPFAQLAEFVGQDKK